MENKAQKEPTKTLIPLVTYSSNMDAAALPEEIIINILHRLPVKSLLPFRCVCKSWRSLIKDPYFVRKQLNHCTSVYNNTTILTYSDYISHLPFPHYSRNWDSVYTTITASICKSIDISRLEEEEEEATSHHVSNNNNNTPIVLSVKDVDFPALVTRRHAFIKGCCDGIICIVDCYCVTLWNPSIKEYKRLPILQQHCRHDAYGIGYDTSVDDYKVLRVPSILSSKEHSRSSVEVLSLKSNSWKTIQYNFLYGINNSHHSIFTNGGIHWMAMKIETGEKMVILCFDVVTEKFREVPLPYGVDTADRCTNELHLFRGNLSVVPSPYMNEFDVWVMKEYGLRESWVKLFTFPVNQGLSEPLTIPFCFTKTGVVLLEERPTKIVMYNPRNRSFRASTSATIDSLSRMIAYVESLVSPIRGSGTGGLTYISCNDLLQRKLATATSLV